MNIQHPTANIQGRILALLLSLTLGTAHAGTDLQQAAVFSDGQRITASQLNALVGDSSILPTFLSSKTTAPALTGAELLLLYSGTSLYKLTLNSLLFQNTAIITGLAAKTAPTAADYFLIYDATGAALKKVTLDNLTWANFLVYSNLYRNFPYTAVITNLATEGTPANIQYLFAAESFAANRKITPHSLLYAWTQLFDYNNLTANSRIPITVPSGTEAGDLTISIQDLLSYMQIQAGMFAGTRFNSQEYAITAGQIVSTNHSLGSVPNFSNWVLVCKTNDVGGFLAGDEVPVQNFYVAGTSKPNFNCGANGTNVFLACTDPATLACRSKTNGAVEVAPGITAIRWRAKNHSLALSF
jgi:hypothetical protein